MAFLRNIWKSNSKHKKLYEEWALTNIINKDAMEYENQDQDSVNFTIKYLGSTLVEAASSEGATAEAIKTILRVAKVSGKKLQRVLVNVSLRGIRITDLSTDEELLDISIYRISYCSADASHDHVFAFIAANANETMECHAFLCPKRKVTQAVTLTVAKAFNAAYEAWRKNEEKRNLIIGECSKSIEASATTNHTTSSPQQQQQQATTIGCRAEKGHNDDITDKNSSMLIDFNSDMTENENLHHNSWVCFDENEDSTMNNINHNTSNNTTQQIKQHHTWGEKQTINLLTS